MPTLRNGRAIRTKNIDDADDAEFPRLVKKMPEGRASRERLKLVLKSSELSVGKQIPVLALD